MAIRQDSGPGDPLDDAPPPATTSGSGTPSPIGVPEYMYDENGKVVPYRTSTYKHDPEPYSSYGAFYDVPPKYFDGDEYIPTNYPSTNIFQLQQALARVGLLTGTFTKNVWDKASQAAYRELLGMSNRSGLTADQMLAELLATAGDDKGVRFTVDEFGNIVPAGAAGSEVPPLVTRTTDPAALRSTFRRAVIEMLGEGWSTEQINNMVKAYNSLEVQKQTEVYNLGVNQQAGSVTDIPTPEQFVESQVLQKDPIGVQSHEALGFTQEFMDVASSPAWGIG